jgi:capsular exopolysaccharide synthesis family protein
MMSPDNTNNNNQIEVFKPGEPLLERRRTPHASARIVEIEKAPDLLAYWKMIRKRRWTVLTAFTLLFAIVLVETLKQKPVYRAKALLEIDKENPSLVTPQEFFQLDEVTDTYLETEYKVLGSDDLAERVINQLHLDQVSEFRPQKRLWPWTVNKGPAAQSFPTEVGVTGGDASIHESVLAGFENRLDIKPFRRSRAVEISFTSQDPILAASVVNKFTSNYIDKNLEARWDATQKASEWLSQQMLDLKAKLEKSQDELQKYAADNDLLFLETDKGNSENVVNQSLRELQEELTKTQAARYEKESLHRLVLSSDYGSLPGVFDNKLLQDISVRLAELQRERAQLAATFTGDYPKVQQVQSQIAEIQSALERERRRAAQRISNDYFAAVRRESLVQRAFADKQKQANLIAEKSVQYGILSREVETNKSIYDGLLQRLKEAGVSAGLKASNIRIVDPAMPPFKPVSPKIPLNLALAAILGLGLGVSAAFIQEHLDQTIENADDVDRYLRLPGLAFIPSLQSLNGHSATSHAPTDGGLTLGLTSTPNLPNETWAHSLPRTDLASRKNGDLSEAFRGLRTSVLLSSGGRPASSILVTSAQSGEGKTTISVNLAISLAQLGRRVLLIDADMRRPTLQKYFPQSGSQLGSYLAGEGAWQDMTFQTAVGGLYVLLCGPLPVNPGELLSSDRMRALLREAATEYSFVILDSPPLLNAADARILASAVDATILVVKGGDTPRQVVQYAESQARAAGANLMGVVLNNLNFHSNGDSYYAYGYYNTNAHRE